jgi:hypothetical protein
MTIRKFGSFGTSVSRPPMLNVLRSDLEIAQHYVSGDIAAPCTLTNGSIAQSLGISSEISIDDPLHDQQMTLVNIDLLQIDYRTTTSTNLSSNSCTSTSSRVVVAGTLVIQHRTRLSTCLILSNSGILHARDVLPRAHPNDGFVDVLEVDPKISTRQRAIAWHRSATGSHLPHPDIRVSRSIDFQWSGSPAQMIADGVTYKGVVWLQCTVLADAMCIYF